MLAATMPDRRHILPQSRGRRGTGDVDAGLVRSQPNAGLHGVGDQDDPPLAT